ncbi:MAG: DUF4276 family protein [Candidatus Hodarchaeales archaeon]|nr:DUF4276 family protein [Deltaproteobacteria bacterium]
MRCIVPIVEGDGEVKAVPILLHRTLEYMQKWQIRISYPPINAHGIGNLLKEGGLEKFLKLAIRRDYCYGIIVIIDADTYCARDVAMGLAKRALNHNPHIPTAIVAAKYRYENWFLASIETIKEYHIFRKDMPIIYEPESIPDPIRWLEKHMDQRRAYRETMDQEELTKKINLDLALERSRSFKRLFHATEELLNSISSGIAKISPMKNYV